jgi:LCP family protein required for cell wall assembly
MSTPTGNGPRSGPRRYGPNAAQQPATPGNRPAPPRRTASAQAWSELDGQHTRMMPAAQQPASPPGPGGPGGPGGPIDRDPPRQYGGPTGGSGAGRRQAPGWLVAGRIVLTVLALVVLTAAGLGTVWNQTGTSSATEDAKQAAPAGKGMNILLIGSDARTNADGTPLSADELKKVATEASGGTNTDTIMVLHIPGGGARATAVSIPRDTWINQAQVTDLPGPYSTGAQGDYKPNKINAFYGTAKAFTQQALADKGVDGADRELQSSEAGRKMLVQVVSRFTGLHIDHFAEVNLIAFYTISNAIGGVPVCLNKAVNDPMSGANFKAGPQEIQGTAALSFVRQRHGLPNSDLDRVRRQQAFLSGAIKKVLSQPTSIPALVAASQKTLVMDNKLDLATLAAQMKNLSSGNVTFATIATHGAAKGTNTDALATDSDEIRTFFAGLDGARAVTGKQPTASSTAAKRLTVDVQNGTMTAGLGKTVSERLGKAGLTVSDPTDMPGKSHSNELDVTEIHYPAGAQALATKVQKALGFGELTADSQVVGGHVLVVAGKDAPKPADGLHAGQALQPLPAAAPTSTAPAPADSSGCVN